MLRLNVITCFPVEYRWEFEPIDADVTANLQKELGIHPILCTLLVQRGITNYEQAKQFFRPELEHLHDPLLLKGMRLALDRIDRAISQKETVVIYGDYDVDGTTAVSLVFDFFRPFFDRDPEQLQYYIPDRNKEGYGLSEAGVQFAANQGAQLLITLDCGIKAVDRVEQANSLGIDVIITDHHLPGAELPNALAILNPKQSDCPYPFKDLCGCGIGLKLIQGYVERHSLDKASLYQGLDLVAVSIAADIVPTIGENRVLTYYGLRQLESHPRPGLKALMYQAAIKAPLTIRDLVFGLAPRINAAGRMGHAHDAVRMLLADGEASAKDGAGELHLRNNHRKEEDKGTTREALDMIGQWDDQENRFSTVVYSPGWHKGVIGIVASRLIETYYRPTIVLTESNGMAVGSARSVDGFDVHEAILECRDLLDRFGGHQFAAGLSLPIENLPAFSERFEAAVKARILPEQRIPRLRIDAELALGEVSPSFYKILRQFEPFGPGNPSPVFASLALQTAGSTRVLKDAHLKLQVKPSASQGPGNRSTNSTLDGIAFGQAHALDLCRSGKTLAMAFHVEENHWQGKTTLQLQIKSIKNTLEVEP